MSTKIIDMDKYAINKLQKYGVKIKYDPTVQENRGYVFTPATIDAHPKKCARCQLAIKLMVLALKHR